VVGELPADDHPRGQVDHRGQVEPALTGAQVGDVADEPFARRAAGRVEVTPDQVRGLDGLLAGDRGALVGARLHRFELEFAHQVRDQPNRALVALPVQRRGDAPAAEGLPRVVEDPLDLLGEFAPPLRSGCLGPVAPRVVRRARDAEQPTHPDDRVGGLLRLNERAALCY
jgi:hypothetical protein